MMTDVSLAAVVTDHLSIGCLIINAKLLSVIVNIHCWDVTQRG
jgi:hypothetical protein